MLIYSMIVFFSEETICFKHLLMKHNAELLSLHDRVFRVPLQSKTLHNGLLNFSRYSWKSEGKSNHQALKYNNIWVCIRTGSMNLHNSKFKKTFGYVPFSVCQINSLHIGVHIVSVFLDFSTFERSAGL